MRAPYAERVTEDDVRAAALQYVRKVSGFRVPAAHNAEAFNQAVDAVTDATRALLGQLEVRHGQLHPRSLPAGVQRPAQLVTLA